MFDFNPQKRLQIIKFISSYSLINKKAPIIKEIAKDCGYKSLSGVHEQLVKLGFSGEKGWWSRNKKELMQEYRCPTCGRKIN